MLLSKITAPVASSQPAQKATIDVAALLGTLRRQWPLIAGTTAAMLLAGLAYLLTAAPLYTASASIMIDTRKNQLFQNQQVVGDLQIDSGVVESQVEVLKSESVALAVIRELKLIDDPGFTGGGGASLIGFLKSSLGLGEGGTASDNERERRATAAFDRSLKAKRVGMSYVIELTYTSFDPNLSARIANSIADSYMVGELDAKYQATKRASRWLQERMAELREQALKADAEVQAFKAENNIVDVGRGLMSEQQLADVNTQLVAARASTAEAKARLDRIQSISANNLTDATVTDALRNDVINRLRAQFLDLSSRAADISARYGIGHQAAVNLRNQMAEIRRSIIDEVKRIAETYKSEYEIALGRQAALEESLNSLVGQAALTGQAQIKLRDLESSAQSYRNLYDNFLQRFMEATQQQSFPVSEARLITPSTPPLSKSWPRGSIVGAACLALGLCFGAAAAIARESLDNVFRTVGQVEEVTGVECLGVVPELGPATNSRAEERPADPSTRSAAVSGGILRHVLDAPFSRFAETLRSAKVAADLRALSQEVKVVGIASALPNEGKTTVAANLAQLIAHSGQRVVLVDGDLRNPSLTRHLVPEAKSGLLELLGGHATEEELIWTDPVTGLKILPTVIDGRISHTAELLSSPAMSRLLDRLRTEFDFVLVDLPPIAPVVDVRAVAHLIDGFVFVIEWGRTTKSIIAETIGANDMLQARALGAVLNKANPSMLRRIESYKGGYYRSYYSDGDRAPRS